MMMEGFPLVSEIMDQSIRRTVEILNAIQSGSAAENLMGFIFVSLWQLGMVAFIMACATAGTVGSLKLIKKFFGEGRDK